MHELTTFGVYFALHNTAAGIKKAMSAGKMASDMVYNSPEKTNQIT